MKVYIKIFFHLLGAEVFYISFNLKIENELLAQVNSLNCINLN